MDYLKILSLIVLFCSQSRAVLLVAAPTLHCYSYLLILQSKALVRTGTDCTGDPVDTTKKTWSFCCCKFADCKNKQMEHGKRGHNVHQNDQGCCWQPQGQHNYRLFCFFFFLKMHFTCPPFGGFICIAQRWRKTCRGTWRDNSGERRWQEEGAMVRIR